MNRRGRRTIDALPMRAAFETFLGIAVFPLATVGRPTDRKGPSVGEETLATIRNWMARSERTGRSG